MKKLLFALFALFATSTFADEKAAIEGFKKEVTDFKTWSDEKEKSFKSPADGLAAFGEMGAKIKAIKTEGLPADLKEPWDAMLVSLAQMVALLEKFPKDAAEIEKKFADQDFMKEFGAKADAIQEALKPNIEKLKEAGKKYGIEGLENFGPK